MAQLMKLSTFRAHYFAPGNAPTVKTLKRLIETQELAGRKIGGQYYVDAQKFELTGDSLVDSVLLAS